MELGFIRRNGGLYVALALGALWLGAWSPMPSAAATVPAWMTYARDPQHTALSSQASQPLALVRWSTPVDVSMPSYPILIHYGSPLVTPGNTVIVPVKTTSAGGFVVEARRGQDGGLLWSQSTDYVVPPHGWMPSYSPTLTPSHRVYFAGAGGTVYFRDNVDSSGPAASGQLAFFGLNNYTANPQSFNTTVFVNTAIVSDSAGTIYFGFRTVGTAPSGLQSGIARIDVNGNGSWTSAAAAAGDNSIISMPHQAAPALSLDELTLYVPLRGANTTVTPYLVGLDAASLAPKVSAPGVPMRVALKDPRNGGANNAFVSDDSSASPMVGPDGDVYYGILPNPLDSSRGWMLHFSADLTQTKPPGAFGWDTTPSVVPVSMVPSYSGDSPYLIFTKYNDYAGSDGGQGVNKVAVLDPNHTMIEPHPSSNGQLVMNEVLTAAGVTPDAEHTATYPNAVREWCINSAAVDPATGSILVNSEDGKLYRWNLTTQTLSESVTLSAGVGEAYTPTVIGPDGTVYAINAAMLNAVGQMQQSALSINDVLVTEGDSGTHAATFTVTLSPASTQTVSVSWATGNGTAVAGSDYTAAAGTLSFPPGATSRTLSVAVTGDKTSEANETFSVSLSNATGATLTDAIGQATIVDDDPFPSLSIQDKSGKEGNSGTTTLLFTVKLSAASGQPVSVAYATADGTAMAASDYVAASGVLTFPPGTTSRTIPITVISDTVKESNETFFVDLRSPSKATIARRRGQGTISNDDR
jgi:hypothetical protein